MPSQALHTGAFDNTHMQVVGPWATTCESTGDRILNFQQ